MDTLLKEGDFAVDSRGYPIACSEMQELLQRALIRLTVRRGSFDLDPQLGSRLYGLKSADRNLPEQALEFVREALLPLPELTPLSVEIHKQDGGQNLLLTVLLQLGAQKQELEVSL